MNQFVTSSWVAKEVARMLVNRLRFGANVNRSYDDQFAKTGAKVGYTVNARLPQRYTVNKGQALVIQPVNDQVVPITLTDQANIGIEFSMASLAMEIDDYRERYIVPAVNALVNQIDYDGMSRMYQTVANTVGTPGTVPTTNLTYLDAGVKLNNLAVPPPTIAMLNPRMHATLVNANQALFGVPNGARGDMWRTGQFGNDALGIDEWFMTQNVPVHTVGPLGGTPLVNGASQSGSSLVTDGWTAAVAKRLNKGDVIQLSGVYMVNPMNRQSVGELQDFVVQADVYSDGSGNATIPIYPSIVSSGQLQTVDSAPADNAPITIFGHASSHANRATPQGLIYNRDAFTLVTADLPLPGGVWAAERISNKQLGISVRFVKDYDIMSDQSPARLDVIYGWAALRPELAVRVAS
jgi:hypothetical protein